VISPEVKKVLELFQEGRKLYNLRRFAEAKEFFKEALAVKSNDGPSKEFIERCDVFIANPPPEDWDGVYDMKTK
jgi:hypothetical protein